jgi:hypothetical protein
LKKKLAQKPHKHSDSKNLGIELYPPHHCATFFICTSKEYDLVSIIQPNSLIHQKSFNQVATFPQALKLFTS